MSRTRQDILDDLFNLKIKRGYTEYQLKEYLMSAPYNYSIRNTQLYLKMLREHIVDTLKDDKEYYITATMEQLDRIYQDLLREGNKKLALEYKKEITKMRGAYPTQKVDITSNGENIIPQIIYLNIPNNDGINN
jgi:hypothetical protein